MLVRLLYFVYIGNLPEQDKCLVKLRNAISLLLLYVTQINGCSLQFQGADNLKHGGVK